MGGVFLSRWSRVFVLAVVVVFASAAQAECRPRESFRARVVAVHDGDTVTVLRGREQVRVRLWGIDAPERGQPFSNRASRELADMVFRRTVTVVVMDTDTYGRTVARLYVANLDVNREMVRRGMAWWYTYFARGARDLAVAEAEARAAGRGLWVDKNPVAPWDYRRRRR